jgi:hypothetical protein
MDDAPAQPWTRLPHRRRRAAFGLVLAIGCGLWLVDKESETVKRAQRLKLGQTEIEVEAIMGPPCLTRMRNSQGDRALSYATPFEHQAVEWRTKWARSLRRRGRRLRHMAAYLDAYLPVEVRFSNGRVTYIQRGSEAIGG